MSWLKFTPLFKNKFQKPKHQKESGFVAFCSVRTYFGVKQAYGIDHFDASIQRMAARFQCSGRISGEGGETVLYCGHRSLIALERTGFFNLLRPFHHDNKNYLMN